MIVRAVSVGLVILLTVPLLIAEEPLPEPESPLVVVFSGGTWVRARTVEFQNGAIIYMEMSGRLVSAPKQIVDVETTQATNSALEEFAAACKNPTYAPLSGFQLEGRSASLFNTMAEEHDRTCLHLMREKAEQQTRMRAIARSQERAASARTPYATPSREELKAAQEEYGGADTAYTPRVVTPTPGGPPAGSSPRSQRSSQPNTSEIIKAHCRVEWPDDYQMQNYCKERQEDGLRELRTRSASSVGMDQSSFDTMRRHCRAEWPDDYQMQNYCEERQVEGWRGMNK